mmetsp:Transcript_5723/g.16664  ORF Transcript_5723/g.16664 Transcript_5723/m.16664 type:complete len:217 (-) Transcript_5723:174-824(-)
MTSPLEIFPDSSASSASKAAATVAESNSAPAPLRSGPTISEYSMTPLLSRSIAAKSVSTCAADSASPKAAASSARLSEPDPSASSCAMRVRMLCSAAGGVQKATASQARRSSGVRCEKVVMQLRTLAADCRPAPRAALSASSGRKKGWRSNSSAEGREPGCRASAPSRKEAAAGETGDTRGFGSPARWMMRSWAEWDVGTLRPVLYGRRNGPASSS